jgi:transposase
VRAVALDVHRDFCEVAIVAEGRLRSAGRIATRPDVLELFAQSLGAGDWVALEVTGNAWAIARILEPHVARVIAVSPSDTGIRQARAKTDRLDARTLAKLLWAGELDGVWTPDERVRAMRRRLARRAQLVRGRSRVKNEIHAVLMRCLKDRPPAADLFGVKGRAWLNDQQLPACERETVDAGLRQVDFLDTEIAQVDQLIAADALGWPEVKRLMTVPGVNVIVAATFMAAVGDIRRFPDRRMLTAYLGLDPRVRQSGAGPANHGHISKQGSGSARHALVEACWSTVRQPGPIAAFYARVKAKRGHSIAIVASARKLALPVLVPAHPRRGLRVRPALADGQEDAPARARRRRPAPPGRARRLVDQQGDAPSRTRPRAPSPARLRAHRRRLAGQQGGRGRDTGARITKAVKRHTSAADHKPQDLRFSSSSPAPNRTLPQQPATIQTT